MIEMHDLTKVYRTSDVETSALNHINLEIEAGEFIAIMGPSGCGKSTLLNVMGMLDSPSAGSYRFLGEDIAGYSESRLARIRKQNLGFIFQSFNLVDELTVAENVMLP
jgi:putative ABC transport system ATP-binding protein